MTLNYRDCHAKIRQVDSHETLANGVVVQVRIFISLLNIIRHSALSVNRFAENFPITGDP